MRKLERLSLVQPTPEYAANTCGPYWYLVLNNGTSETAFCRRESFLDWMRDRGLSLSAPLVEQGEHSYQAIIGEYNEQMHGSYDEFYSLPDVITETRQLSNGRYTLARITGSESARTVHTMNVNCHHRHEYDYSESRAIYG